MAKIGGDTESDENDAEDDSSAKIEFVALRGGEGE